MLWADPDYTSNEMAKKEAARSDVILKRRRRSVSANQISRPKKTPKTDQPQPESTDQPAPSVVPEKLTPWEWQILSEHKRRLGNLLKQIKLTNNKANLPELLEEITKRDRETLKVSEIKLTSMIKTIVDAKS